MTRSTYRPITPPRAVEGKPRFTAQCRKCGRDGKSQTPDGYLCTICYHENNANSCVEKIEQLKARIAKIEDEARYHRSMADKYSLRWDRKPSKVEGDRQSIPPDDSNDF